MSEEQKFTYPNFPENLEFKEPHFTRYIKFIESRSLREIPEGIYTEKHHIVPKGLGGSNEKDNLIVLTAREHYIAHMILWKCFGKSMSFSFFRMVNSNQNGNKLWITNREYQKLREEVKKLHKSRRNKKIIIHDPVTMQTFHIKKEKLVEYLELGYVRGIGWVSPHKGKCKSEETIKKIKSSNQVSCRTTEFRRKMSEVSFIRESNKSLEMKEEIKNKTQKYWQSEKGQKKKEEFSKRMKRDNPSKYISKEVRKKVGQKMRNKIWIKKGEEQKFINKEELQDYIDSGWSKGKIPHKKKQCPHCGKWYDPGNYAKHMKNSNCTNKDTDLPKLF